MLALARRRTCPQTRHSIPLSFRYFSADNEDSSVKKYDRPPRAKLVDKDPPPSVTYKADRSVVENWKEVMKTMDEMMDEIEAKRPKQYMPNKFKEMKAYNDTDGKVVVSKLELTPVSQAPEMPSLKVKNLNDSEFDMKNLTGGKLTLLLTCFKNSGFDNLQGWRDAFEKSFGEKNPMVQIVQLNIIEEWYVKLMPGMIRNGLRSKVPELQYNLTCVYYGRCDEFRATLDLFNSFVGYVQLVDAKGRVRWTSAGNITPEESTVMTLLSSKLLSEISQKPRK
ncbi:Aste57867_2811 [Aphanomyces stellatus]|uniref:Aste57867_2811 protein n=1 Tax=Aphanomyces stellatus TaxID=120398 RepID=A0A485KE11_9STRA|nr:hypothetical protein As57867_002804 [Aphanomyces stellatus]VFT79999.1 Aste57867_2811 [Aphanomyces stellatus]